MKGMISLPGLDKAFKLGKRFGFALKAILIVVVFGWMVHMIVMAADPVRRAAKTADRIMIEETEQTYRFCIRKAVGPQELQHCKDQFLQEFR